MGKLLDAAQESGSKVIMISTTITHNDIHKTNMRRLHDLAVERGIRDELILIAGGTQVTDENARECGMDAGFGNDPSCFDFPLCVCLSWCGSGM